MTGLALLSTTRLLVADGWNKSVKIVSCDMENAGVLGSVKLPQSPFDVTITPGDVAAVTIPDMKQIVFIQAQGDTLTQIQPSFTTTKRVGSPVVTKKEIYLSGKCFGIHFNNGRLYVVCEEEDSENNSCYIVMINIIDGQETKKCNKELPLQSRYIAIMNEKLYVTHPHGVVRIKDIDSSQRRSLRSKFVKEQPVKHVSTLRHVHGIVEVAGDILVGSVFKAGVFRILNMGSMLRGAVLVVNQPRAVCFCPDSRRLIVSHPRSIGNKANFLTVGRV